MLIAYSGIEGSFAGIATEKIFPNQELLSCYTFREAYDQVEKGNCEACVLPIENSYAGEIGQVSDLMFAGTLKIRSIWNSAQIISHGTVIRLSHMKIQKGRQKKWHSRGTLPLAQLEAIEQQNCMDSRSSTKTSIKAHTM